MTLKTEVTTDPLGRGYSGMTDLAVAESLNTKDIAVRRDVPWSTVFKFAVTQGFWQKIVAASRDVNHIAYETAIAAVELKDVFRDDVVDTGHDMFTSLSTDLVNAELMTADQRTMLIAMGDTLVSRAEQLGLPYVYEGHIQGVR